ncbi:MAG: HYR domain-containing protein, partial [Thaumarchaeota archaeon]|nr:HYR domain-containing protein [Nitrososphaerota archaeon]
SVSVSSEAPEGDYRVTITGTSSVDGQKITRSTFFIVKVRPPSEFNIEAKPNTLTIAQGGIGSTTVKTTATKSFQNPINLLVWFKSSGFSSKLSGDGKSTMDIMTQSFTNWFVEPKQNKPTNTKLEIKVDPQVPPGTYFATIEGTMKNVEFGAPKHTIPLTIHVTANPEFTQLQDPTPFDIELEHRQVTLDRGATFLNDVKIWSERPDEGVTFTVSVSPANGVSASINEKLVTPNKLPVMGVSVIVAVSENAKPGTYTVTLTGKTSTLYGKKLTQITNFEVIVPEKNEKTIDDKKTEVAISKDVIKSLYTISKLHESAAVSLSSENDQQKIILQKATSAANKDLTKEQKTALKPLLKEQDSDKKDIKLLKDYTKKISSEIKKLAQKQGLKSSELDKIVKTKKADKSSKNPINQLKQDAADAKNNLDAAKKLQEEQELAKIGIQIGNILNDSEGKSDCEKNMEKLFEEQQNRLRQQEERESAKKQEQERIRQEQERVKQEQEAEEKSKQNVIDMMQQLLELVQKEEQSQTSSILDTIPDPTLKELTTLGADTPTKPTVRQDPSKPVTQPRTDSTNSKIQLQSKHSSYTSPNNPCVNNQSTILATWVISKSSNIGAGKAHVSLTNLDDSSEIAIPQFRDATVRDGVVQQTFAGVKPGHYQVALSSIDNRVVENSAMNITVPDLCTGQTQTPDILVEPSHETEPSKTNTKPTLTIPKQVTQEATGPSGAAVNYNVSGQDKEDGAITPSCSYPSGYTFPIGTTTVSCTVDDSDNNSISGTFIVTVRDTTPPNIPAFQPTEGVRDDTGVQVFFEVTAFDLVDGNVPASCNYQSGYKFPIGTTVLTCTADDSRGNHASRSLQITVTIKESGQ